jgi:two-component sensor histidine kinase
VRTENAPTFERAISWSLDHPLPRWQRYAAATIVIGAVAIIRAELVTGLLPWLLFIPPILAVALLLGEGAGFYATALAAVLAAATIGHPSLAGFLTPPQWAGSALFLLTGACIVRVGGEVRAAFRRVRKANLSLAGREAFLSNVLASSTDCIKVLDLDGRLSFMSDGGMKVMEISDFNAVDGCPWPDFWEGDGNVEAQAALEEARLGRVSHFAARGNTHLGNSRWWDVSVSPILGVDGLPAQILSVSRDTTVLLHAKEQQALLNDELSHRLKNVLAMVQAIARQTFRQGGSLEEVNNALSSRLVALGRATDVLTSTAWQSAMIHDVIGAGMISMSGTKERVHIDGPDVRLDAQVALAMSLALHELTTNASKYGALSNETGTISITWSVDRKPNLDQARFRFRWQESGGPRVELPTRRGFGSKLIERSLQPYFRGDAKLDYAPDGVTFEIDAPLPGSAADVKEH